MNEERWLGRSQDGTGWKIGPITGGVIDEKKPGARGVRILGELVWFYKVDKTQDDSVLCNTGCKRATEPECRCSCGGKNHGAENKGLAETGEMPEVVYVGDH